MLQGNGVTNPAGKLVYDEPMVSTQVLQPVVERLRMSSIDLDPLLRRFGIERRALDDVNELLPLRSYVDFFEESAAATSNLHLGLEAGRFTDPGGLGAISFLFLSAPTLRDAFLGLRDYLAALQEGTSIELHVDDAHASFVYLIRDETISPRRQDSEFSISATYNLIAKYLGARFEAREVWFEHTRVGAQARYESHFGCDVFFDQTSNSIVLDKESLDISSPSICDKLYPIIASHLRHLIEARAPSSSLSGRISDLLDARFLAERPTVSRVAVKLGMSESTLARRLRLEGTSFHEVLTQKRMNMAQRMLAYSDTSIAEIALSVGYAENASFSRAFKAWCGSSPESYRRLERRA